ncbi:hypothetical protein SAZ11_48690 [Streptomyces sp. FXJ1.4098]|nr:hypothetical protein [Streptomyces sp. FXJ1.4098]
MLHLRRLPPPDRSLDPGHRQLRHHRPHHRQPRRRRPYWTGYHYNTAGQRSEQTEHTTAGDTTTKYTYGTQTGQPHPLTKTETNGGTPAPTPTTTPATPPAAPAPRPPRP